MSCKSGSGIRAVRIVSTILILVQLALLPSAIFAKASASAEKKLNALLLGKEVSPLLGLPAAKYGVNIYFIAPKGKRTDARGLDLADLTKYLKSKGVGVEAKESSLITQFIVDNDRVEVHLGGGGEGRRGSNHANKVSPTAKRAGGSRINFRYQRDLTDADLEPAAFLQFMERVLDVSQIRSEVSKATFSADMQSAIDAKTVKEGMTYQMVLMSFGDPEQKKINDTGHGDFSETWYYLKDGRRWVMEFANGKLFKIQAF